MESKSQNSKRLRQAFLVPFKSSKCSPKGTEMTVGRLFPSQKVGKSYSFPSSDRIKEWSSSRINVDSSPVKNYKTFDQMQNSKLVKILDTQKRDNISCKTFEGVYIDEKDFDDAFDFDTKQLGQGTKAHETSSELLPWSSSPMISGQLDPESREIGPSPLGTTYSKTEFDREERKGHKIELESPYFKPQLKNRHLDYLQQLHDEPRNNLFGLLEENKIFSESNNANLTAEKPQKRTVLPWDQNCSDYNKLQNIFKTKTGKRSPAVRPKRSSASKLQFSDEQRKIMHIILNEKANVFYTGSAGTGKSILLQEIIANLKKKYNSDHIGITASTGLAACNIGGVTLHSFAGIGIGKDPVPILVKKVNKNRKSLLRWRSVKVLVIDEDKKIKVYALKKTTDHLEFVEMLNEMREGNLSKTSIDKFRALSRQPVLKDKLVPTELFATRYEVDKANASRVANLPGELHEFVAIDGGNVYDKQMRDRLLQNLLAPSILNLKEDAQVMLIKNIDEQLVNGSLGRVIGYMNDTTFQLWKETDPGVDDNPYDYNLDELIEMSATTSAEEKRKRRKAVDQMLANPNKQKVWPLVRFVFSNGLSRDILCQPEIWKVEGINGELLASRQQVPLILAYAISIHKAQGQTLESVMVDLDRIFEDGQAYVAISRATSREGLQIKNFNPSKVKANQKVKDFYRNLQELNDEKDQDSNRIKSNTAKSTEKQQATLKIFKKRTRDNYVQRLSNGSSSNTRNVLTVDSD